MRRRLLSITVAALTAVGVAVPLALTAPAKAVAPPVAAPGAPGVDSHFDLARKDCLGTARNTTSKIWYTVAGGVLSDVYAPTVDTTNVETMQYIVTDGSTFTDLQSRATTYTVSSDPTGMICTVVSTAKSGTYRLTSTYLTDPARDTVVVHTRYTALSAAARSYHLYVRLDATAGGNGGGGAGNGGADSAVIDRSTGSPVPVSYDPVTTTIAVNRDYAVPTYLALRADRGFRSASSGFVGTASDALTQLDTTHTLSPQYETAVQGNVEQGAEVSLSRHGANQFDTTLALGFGTSQAAAVATAGATLHRSLAGLVADYELGWLRYDAVLKRPSRHLPGLSSSQAAQAVRQYYLSSNVVKSSEDKTFPGAIVASLASPWGQAVLAGDPKNTYFGSYREVFARDLYEAWTGLLTNGDLATARAATRFLFLRQQQPDGSMPRNSLLNGKSAPDSFNIQLDEVAYPILMAYQSGLSSDATLWPHVEAAADYLISHGPSAGPERWEEQGGFSPSTIAAEIAGLVAAAHIAIRHGATAEARVFLATADQYQRNVKKWTVTTNGPDSTQPYFIRLSKTGDPNAAISYAIGNGGPSLDQRTVIDAGFLELVRLGELSATDQDVQRSLTVVDSVIKRQTDVGAGWLRYNNDGYGDCHLTLTAGCAVEGAPWAPSGKGTGHIWPVLTAERAQQTLATGGRAAAGALLATMNLMTSGVGLVPEQVWDAPSVPASPAGSDPTTASIGQRNGKPDGSASPLTWGAAANVRLTADLTAGRSLETPRITVNRYVRHHQGSASLTVTSPADLTNETGQTTVTVAGTTVPGARVDVANVGTDRNSNTLITSAIAGHDGSFAIPVSLQNGTNVLVVSATAPNGATAQAVRTVVNDVVAGTKLLDVPDPTGDDNGPGTYAYPTAPDFVPGAYDLTDFQVYDTGSTVTFRVQTRDLTPTFGSPLGAQLIDVYVHAPGVTPTSTNAAFTSRNYTVAAADAWNRLIEVEGFGQQFTDAGGTTLGTVAISANAVSRFITFSVDKAQLGGTPVSGWSFTVTLAGQDGFSPDQARAFTPTPGAFSFGVCAAGNLDPHCAVSPASVPKVMDTIVASGTTQAGELDFLAHPVVLTGVAIP